MIIANKVCLGDVSHFSCNLENIKTWFWDFGDGQTSNLAVPNHLYSSPGLYAVSLSATYADKTVQVLKKELVVSAKPEKPKVVCKK